LARSTDSAIDGPLVGLRVLDCSTVIAGPTAAMVLGDFGADVIKVEHPRGDPLRTHGHAKDGHGLWWKILGRNKRCVTLNLSHPEGQVLMLRLVETADVLIENFRPRTLERWNLGWDRLHAANSRLVMVRMTGFGQEGPYRDRPGFGTLAEAMSGFAHGTGEADGPPTLPPFGLADGIAGLAAACATMFALYSRDARGGAGQVIDASIVEPIMLLIGGHVITYQQLGIIQERRGNRSVNNAPRNTYRTSDGRWVAIASSTTSIAERVMRLVGRADLTEQPWFAIGSERAKRADEIDGAVAAWIRQRPFDEVMREFERAQAALAPVYDARQIAEDPHFRAMEAITEVPDHDLGPLLMQNVMVRMLGTPGRIRHAGRQIGQDNEIVYGELGLDGESIGQLRLAGVV
jgi:crotonobetainyl-CoA:carnitine CoA-transferase CaiB-like acyl-CoA transferase